MLNKNLLYITPISLLLFSACERQAENPSTNVNSAPVSIKRTGWIKSEKLNEASGIHASRSREGEFFVHNDEGKPYIYGIDETGANLGRVLIVPAKNRDWEDITSVPVGDQRWIVAGDIGDNKARHKSIRLYFAEEPERDDDDHYDGRIDLEHRLYLTYPDGPRDCESMAYDPVGNQILFITKRDKPPRIYSVDLETALTEESAELKFLGHTSKLRPPTPANRAQFGGRTDFISQPTGFDISPDGSEATIVTYRSLYRFKRKPDEDWSTALQRKPTEVVGPPAVQNEAIAYSIDGESIYVTTEKQPTPVYRIRFK